MIPFQSQMEPLRTIRYQREDLHAEPQVCEGSLLTFVYDIPYFDACGVFPPLHIINEIFSRGRAGGGMSPGAKWEPLPYLSPSMTTWLQR